MRMSKTSRRRWPHAVLAGVCVAVAAAAQHGPASAGTGTAQHAVAAVTRWAFVWADQPTSDSYTPNLTYQRNSTGAANTITRLADGVYRVRFTNLAGSSSDPGGNGVSHATAYGSGSSHCNVSSTVFVPPHAESDVRCFDSSGAAVDTRFTVTYAAAVAPPADFGYVLSVGLGSHTPSIDLRFNSTGGVNTVTRTGSGRYTVTMPGLGQAGEGGTVLVTAFLAGSNTCKVGSWVPFGADLFIHVKCYRNQGDLQDTRFSVTYARSLSMLGVSRTAGYVWADQPTADSYTPNTSYQFNTAGGTNTITRHSTGVYSVFMPNLGGTDGHVQVVSYGSTSKRCKVVSWFTNGGALQAGVNCFNNNGQPVDTQYTLSYTR
jgi:hypothetical protein